MPDCRLEPQNTLVVGMTGSGKTTFVLRLLVNTTPACRFIFDDENRVAPRLRVKACYTENELEAALSTRTVIFNPSRMFVAGKGDRNIFDPKRRAFQWFCAWLFNVCDRGPGEKIISLPEIWRFCTPDSIPPEFAALMQMGRELNAHVVLDTQRPELVNESVIGAATELVCFKLIAPDALRTVQKIGADAQRIGSNDFRLGQFIAYNRLTGGQLEGKLF